MRYLYIPLEIVVRELDGKALLAFEAVLRGWKVIICSKRQFFNNIDKLPAGHVIIKSAVPNELKQIKKIRNSGHKIFLLDEEGVVTYDIFLKGNYRYNEDTIKLIDAFFFWGQKQHRIFSESYPKFQNIGFNTGAPRYQFWKTKAQSFYKNEIDNLRREYGKYILFNTSFGIANNYLSGEGLQSSYNDMSNVANPELRQFLEDQHDINYIAYKEYLQFIEELAVEFNDINIIVRPHPSESERTWQEFSKKLSNVKIVYSEAVTPWIAASEVMIHFKSTTSIEANVMGVPVVTYLPNVPEYLSKFHLEVPKQASLACFSRSDAIEAIKKVVYNGHDAKGDISNCEWINDNSKSAADIMDIIDNKSTQTESILNINAIKSNDTVKVRLDRIIVELNRVKLIKRFLPKKFIRHDDKYIYGKRKESGFKKSKIKSLIDYLGKDVDHMPKIQVKEIAEKMVLLEVNHHVTKPKD